MPGNDDEKAVNIDLDNNNNNNQNYDLYFFLKGALTDVPQRQTAPTRIKYTNLLLSLPNKNVSTVVLQRVFNLNFFSTDLFSLIIGQMLELSELDNPRGSIKSWNDIESSASGVDLKFKSVAAKLVRYTDVQKATNDNYGYQLHLSVAGEQKDASRIFSLLISAFYDCTYQTKVNFKAYILLECEELVDIAEFEKHLDFARKEAVFKNEKLSLLTLLPEKYLPSYGGKRYLMKDFSKVRVLGKGSFAEAFLGLYSPNNEQYALKELILGDKSSRKYHSVFKEFEHEIDIQGSLDHPSILKIMGIILKPLCIVTEFCPHGDLYQYLTDWKNNFEYTKKIKFIKDIAAGLKYMQDLQPPLAHIDLKSPNIFVFSTDPTDPVCLKIADFGTSQRCHEPITKRYVDNPVWLAPEVLNGEPYDHRADTYAFGVITWEIIVRKRFLTNIHEFDVVDTILSGERPQIPKFCIPQLDLIINLCWANNPLNRPSMDEVLRITDEIQQKTIDTYEILNKKYDNELFQEVEAERLKAEKLKEKKKSLPSITTPEAEPKSPRHHHHHHHNKKESTEVSEDQISQASADKSGEKDTTSDKYEPKKSHSNLKDILGGRASISSSDSTTTATATNTTTSSKPQSMFSSSSASHDAEKLKSEESKILKKKTSTKHDKKDKKKKKV